MADRNQTHDLRRILGRRKQIFEAISILMHSTLDTAKFDEIVMRLLGVFKMKIKKSEAAMQRTLLDFKDKEFTPELCAQLSMRVAGNVDKLKAGKHVPVFTVMPTPEWVPVEITEVRYGKPTKKGVFGRITALVAAGTAASQLIVQDMPLAYVTGKLARELVLKRRERRPAHMQLARMWFLGLVEQGERGLRVDEIKVLPQHRKYNRALYEKRAEPCLRGYDIHCHTCWVGYEDCYRGTHRYSWVKKPCPSCHKDSIYDPSEPGARVCLVCRSRKAREQWNKARRM